MSVAQYQMANAAAGGGVAWNPNMQQPNMGQPSGGVDSAIRGPPGAVGPAQTNESSRGELTGDVCLALDVYASAGELNIAQWSEETCECSVSSYSSSKVVSFTSTGRDLLLNKELSSKDILTNSVDILIGKSVASEAGVSNPLDRLNDAESVELCHDVDVGAASMVPLPRLVALLLVNSLALHQKASPVPLSSAKKGKKANKKKLQTVTLISPVGLNQTQRAVLISAAEGASLVVKNVFNRAVAVLAGGLYTASRAKGLSLLAALQPHGEEGTAVKTPLVLYLNAYSLSAAGEVYYDAALVRCEGSGGAQKVGAKLGFERLNTVATQGGRLPSTGGTSAADLLKHAVDFLFTQVNDTDKGDVSVLVLDGLLVRGQQSHSVIQGVTKESLRLHGSTHVHQAAVADAAVGGSLLSAAELDSSKNYIQLKDGEWCIAYLLPVADGVVEGRAVAVRVQWDQAQVDEHAALDATNKDSRSLGGAAAVFRVGTRVWKEDAGPIPPRNSDHLVQSSFRQEFEWGVSTKVDGKRSVKPAQGWPRVQVLQRGAEGPGWKVLTTLTPLLNVATEEKCSASNSSSAKVEPVQSCNLEVRIDPATGAVTATQTKGRTVSQASSAFWGRLQLAFVLVLPFALIALFYYSGHITEWYEHRQHAAWLADFYQKNAPEKLKDPEYVGRTIAKYKGRMFLLWRGLERAYKVKWQPPHSILDTSAASTATNDEF